MDHDQGVLRSKMGALCSLILAITLITYAVYKMIIMTERKNVDILSALQENHFDDSYRFTADQGLNIAVAVNDPFSPTK